MEPEGSLLPDRRNWMGLNITEHGVSSVGIMEVIQYWGSDITSLRNLEYHGTVGSWFRWGGTAQLEEGTEGEFGAL